MLTFSIITVVKNNAHGIEKTINSLKLQTFQNYEHIIIDSNSTDNTNEVIKNKINQKIVYIREEDKSIYEALNNLNELPFLLPFKFFGLPLPLHGVDGSPTRSIGIIDNE